MPILRDVNLTVREGDRILIRGPSGSGKSTLLQMMAGLAPEYVPGTVAGTVECLYSAKGVVLQNPEAQIVTPTVEEEVAFALENDGLDVPHLRLRVDAILERLGISRLAARHPLTLSGGECQRVSLAAALAREPDVLFLDEPTAYLDDESSRSFFAALADLPARTAVIVVEHRIKAAAAVCTQSWEITADGRLAPSDFREPSLLERIGTDRTAKPGDPTAPALEIRGMSHRFDGGLSLFQGVDLTVRRGEIAALVGPSGCGKTTLLAKIARILPTGSGTVRFGGRDLAAMRDHEFNAAFLYIPQNPEHMFVASTVREELELSGARALEEAERFGLGESAASSPYRLSEGEKRRLNLAVASAERRPLYLLDEPTYGLDDSTRRTLVRDLRSLAADGAGLLLVSHDEEFVRAVADSVFRMKGGKLVREEAARAGSLKSA